MMLSFIYGAYKEYNFVLVFLISRPLHLIANAFMLFRVSVREDEDLNEFL